MISLLYIGAFSLSLCVGLLGTQMYFFYKYKNIIEEKIEGFYEHQNWCFEQNKFLLDRAVTSTKLSKEMIAHIEVLEARIELLEMESVKEINND